MKIGMKNVLRGVIVMAFMAGLGMFSAAQTFAQGPAPAVTPTPVPLTDNDTTLSFSALGFGEQMLHGPFSNTRYLFGLPMAWLLSSGAELQLTLFTNVNSLNSAPVNANPIFVGGSVDVLFNDVLLTTILLDRNGEQTVNIPIKPEALVPTASRGRHQLELVLDSAIDCEYNRQTTVAVRTRSRFVMPHQFIAPPTDLRLLPRPIYQNTFLPDLATIVIPDQPTAAEMQSAFSVAAGFGRMTEGKQNLALVPVGQLSEDALKSNHLIFVGNPGAFPALEEAAFPAPVSGGKLNVPGATPETGVVQMAVSPWSKFKVVLWVTGDSDQAIVKAGQAVSTGALKVSTQPNLALVAQVQANLDAAVPIAVDRTFADLGYSHDTNRGYGSHYTDYRFTIPAGYAVSGDAYLDLVLNHTTIMDYERSGLVVHLNGEPVGSARFGNELAQAGKVRINLPRTAIRPGTNRLEIQGDLIPRSACSDPRSAFLWYTLRSESLLHIPLEPTQAKETPAADLAAYPQLFTTGKALNNLVFVLPPGDAKAWNIAAQIAFDLGRNSDLAVADMLAVYASAVPEDLRKKNDLVLVGKPSTLAFLAELRDVLPAYFEVGSDMAIERSARIVYTIPSGVSVGYLEVIPSPWNSSRAVLAVLGSTDQGLQWAGTTLTQPSQRGKLGGNYVFISGDQIVLGDTRVGVNTRNVAATAVPGGTPQPVELPTAAAPERPGWLLPVLGASLALIFLIVLMVLLSSFRHSA